MENITISITCLYCFTEISLKNIFKMAVRKLAASQLYNLVRGSTKVLCQQPKSTLQQHSRCISLASQACEILIDYLQ